MNLMKAIKEPFALQILSRRLIALAFAFGLPMEAIAQDPSQHPASAALPAPIAKMIETGKGVRFQEKFKAPGGLTGYTLSASNGEMRIYYVTPDGKHAILGIMFDEGLNNLTADHQKTFMNVEEFVKKEDPPITKTSALDLMKKTKFSWSEGKGRNVYVVFDASSPDSKKLFEFSRTRLKEFKIHWIPSALMDLKSMGWMKVFLKGSKKEAILRAAFSGASAPPVDVESFFEAQAMVRKILVAFDAKRVPLVVAEQEGTGPIVLEGAQAASFWEFLKP